MGPPECDRKIPRGITGEMVALSCFSRKASVCLHQKTTVLPAKSDSDVMFCLQSYKGLRIDISLVY